MLVRRGAHPSSTSAGDPRVVLKLCADIVPGGTKNNLEFVSPRVDFDASLPLAARLLLADAQTSGGLLLAVDPASADKYVQRLRERGVEAIRIGTFTEKGEGRIKILP